MAGVSGDSNNMWWCGGDGTADWEHMSSHMSGRQDKNKETEKKGERVWAGGRRVAMLGSYKVRCGNG